MPEKEVYIFALGDTMNAFRSGIAALFYLVFSLGQAWADESPSAMWAVGATAGTLGVGAEASILVYKRVVLRFDGSYLTVPANDTTVTIKSAGATLDVHPFESSFRLSGGMRYLNFEADLTHTTYQCNALTGYICYATAFRDVVTNHDSLAPYAGFGFDSSHFSGGNSDFKLGLDLGAIFAGGADYKIQDVTSPNDSIGITSEKKWLSNRFMVLDWYPVATVSARVAF